MRKEGHHACSVLPFRGLSGRSGGRRGLMRAEEFYSAAWAQGALVTVEEEKVWAAEDLSDLTQDGGTGSSP